MKKNKEKIKKKIRSVDKNKIYAWVLLVFMCFWTLGSILSLVTFFDSTKTNSITASASTGKQESSTVEVLTSDIPLSFLDGMIFPSNDTATITNTPKTYALLNSMSLRMTSEGSDLLIFWSNGQVGKVSLKNASPSTSSLLALEALDCSSNSYVSDASMSVYLSMYTYSQYLLGTPVSYDLNVTSNLETGQFYLDCCIHFFDFRGSEPSELQKLYLHFCFFTTTLANSTLRLYLPAVRYFNSYDWKNLSPGQGIRLGTYGIYSANAMKYFSLNQDYAQTLKNYDQLQLQLEKEFERGKNVGYTQGKEEGYTQGKAAGYTEGVNSAHTYTFGNLLTSVLDVPVATFKSLFNFEILGVNLSSFFLALLTCGIIIAVVRLIL